jgi:3-hydroxy acid dehydrogenase/malonic semialdehyde reductase
VSITPCTRFLQCIIDVPVDFKAKQSGHVINIGSIAGRETYPGGSIYNATKHALRAFTGALMKELVNTPIRVTEIQPGRRAFLLLLESMNSYLIGMVETEFSVIRFRGDTAAASKVYEGLQPSTDFLLAEYPTHDIHCL